MPHIHIDIDFEWYPWTHWSEIVVFAKHRARSPIPSRPGVYEVKRTDTDTNELLCIGSSRNLARWFYNELFGDQGGVQSQERKRLLLKEVDGDSALLTLRWAEIDGCYVRTLECELVHRYARQFGRPPRYNQ